MKAADVFLLNTENKAALRFTISFNVGSSWQAIIIVKPVDWCGAQPTGAASKRWLTNRPTVKPSEAIITIQTFFITQMKANKNLRIFYVDYELSAPKGTWGILRCLTLRIILDHDYMSVILIPLSIIYLSLFISLFVKCRAI